MLQKIRESFITKVVALYLVASFFTDVLMPSRAYALTGGPSQPEVNSFTPAGVDNMVDPYTGDFSYNIPLMDVGGYPLNMAYNSNISMDQEASMVGLGWNLNVGAITRSMRGLPDEFDGSAAEPDKITKDFNMRPNTTYGVSLDFGFEILGNQDIVDGVVTEAAGNFGGALVSASGAETEVSGNVGLEVKYNTYDGVGFSLSRGLSADRSKTDKEENVSELGLGLNVSQGTDGLSLQPSVSYSKKIKDKENNEFDLKSKSAGVSGAYNSRQGFTGLNVNGSITKQWKDKDRKGNERNRQSGIGGSGYISFVESSYTPQIDFPRTGASGNVKVKTGMSLFTIDGEGTISGYISDSRLKTTHQSIPAYGYMKSHRKGNAKNVLLDFNREKDRGFTQHTTNLPVTNQTYDLYSISAQGIGGQFRAHRSEIGHVHDNLTESATGAGDVGLDLSGGNLLDIGLAVKASWSNSHSGNWEKLNDAKAELTYRGANSNDVMYQPYYFKQVGDLSVDDDNNRWLHNVNIRENKAAQLDIKQVTPLKYRLDNKYVDHLGQSATVEAQNTIRNSRAKRNTGIYGLTVAENQNFGLDKTYIDYVSDVLPDHHFGELNVVQGDGSRYVFGLPAVNKTQAEVTFNVSGRNYSYTDGLVTYVSTGDHPDNSVNNRRGTDWYYNKSITPAFAHSHMLTAVLSPDFVDYDGVDGASKGDRGTYVKFNYGEERNGRIEPDIVDYQWRVPFESEKANYNREVNTLAGDDKGVYIYGKKDIWYVHTIETKTHVAEFYYSARKDGYGVAGENGGMGNKTMKKLDRIALYSLADYENGNLDSPIKEVHFEYDYSLCTGIPNNNGSQSLAYNELANQKGKLTLKKVYFTYEGVPQGKLSPYTFNYEGLNPQYNLKGYDMWGNYKPNPNVSNGYMEYTSDFPYVEQDKATQDMWASAWCMTSVETPSGGVINIEYEADDYAYVQDKPAMQMFKIIGAGDSDNIGAANQYLYKSGLNQSANEYLFFEIPEQENGSLVDINQMFNSFPGNYEGGYDFVYFNFLLDLDNLGNEEYVSGYGKFKPQYGVTYGYATGGSGYGWIKLESVCLGDRQNDECQVSPIAKAGWNYGRSINPKLMYGLSDPADGSDQVEILKALASLGSGPITSIIMDGNRGFRLKEYSRRFVPNKSWVRLYNPTHSKLGGGCRVRKITIDDDWDYNTYYNQGSFKYGQEYSYKTEDGKSSGVASYEPLMSRENPLVQPVFFDEHKVLAPDDHHYMEMPFGESFFPSPSVGYSRVEVKNLERKDVDDIDGDSDTDELLVKRHATGKIVKEFYTAKDFPTKTNQTRIDIGRSPKVGNFISQLLKVRVIDYMNVSQGYVVTKYDDMYGKPKKESVYPENQITPISSVEYIYELKTEAVTYNVGTQTQTINETLLSNDLMVINPDGTVSEATVGVEVDMVNDFREQETKSYSVGVDGEVNSFIAGIIPIAPIPTIWPNFSSEHTRFRSSVSTKVINTYGIQRKTIATDLGASVETKNLAWDSETGEVLLTKTTNEYSDELYSFAYPAHWVYDNGMGQLSKNIEFATRVTTNGNGLITTPSNPDNYFVPGDEAYVNYNSVNTKAWVSENSSGDLYLINRAGEPLENIANQVAKIIRSGRRNQHAMSIGSITFKQNPLVDVDNNGSFDKIDIPSNLVNKEVLTAQVTEYSQVWKTFCEKDPRNDGNNDCIDSQEELNNYLSGIAEKIIGSNVFSQSGLPEGQTINCIKYDLKLINRILPADCWNGQVVPCPPKVGFPYFYSFTYIVDGTTINFYGVDSSGATTLIGALIIDEACLPLCGGNGTETAQVYEGECGNTLGYIVNPYVEGLRGNWRPKRSSVYLTERTQAAEAFNKPSQGNDIYTRTDGKYLNFTPFWEYSSTNNNWISHYNNNAYTQKEWTWASEITEFNPYTLEVENRDALFRYSAELFGYNNSLPIAVGNNTTYNQIAFDGFEDYDYFGTCAPQHLSTNIDKSYLTEQTSHTGRYSLKIKPQQNYTINAELRNTVPLQLANHVPYVLREKDCLHGFSPETYNVVDVNMAQTTGGSGFFSSLIGPDVIAPKENKYIVSFWVQQTSSASVPVLGYNQHQTDITINGVPVNIEETVSSSIIEGWQRFEHLFTIPAGQSGDISISITNTNTTGLRTLFLDDIRIHPFNSSMKSYVYDPESLRLWAELDVNNYATFYEYDEQGHLVRIKKETVRGIVTLQENREYTVKKEILPDAN